MDGPCLRVYGGGIVNYELSRQVALIIGWKLKQMSKSTVMGDDCLRVQRTPQHFARTFDIQDWTVIGPIAAHYDIFPYRSYTNKWVTGLFTQKGYKTAQEAIARSVVEADATGIL